MRLDDAGPRTRLLAVVAGWALLAWLLALFGMASRATPLADDPSLIQPLPQMGRAPPERLGPSSQYAEIAARPLFMEDRRPKPFSLQPEGEAEQAKPFDYLLTSVMITPRLRMAILQPSGGGDSIRIKQGESAEEAAGWSLVSVSPRSAVFQGPEGERTLELRAFDGNGGQAPTPATATAVNRPPQPPGGVNRSMPAAPARNASGPAIVQSPSTNPGVATGGNAPVQAAPSPGAAGPGTAAAVQTPEAQIEAIRKRIEARRAQLRRESQQPVQE